MSKCQNQEVDVWVVGHLVTQLQGQILRAAANNRVRGHASVCGYAPPSPTIDYFLCCPLQFKYINNFIVHEHNPLFSDGHSALELSINAPLIVEVGVQNCNNLVVSRQHVKWEYNKRTEFQHRWV